MKRHGFVTSTERLYMNLRRRSKTLTRPRCEGSREHEILDSTLSQLASVGYDRLTMDAVATAAKASKATLYRRWASKAELVIDAIERAKGAPQVADADTGTLRGDLVAMACHAHGMTDQRSLAVFASVITALHRDREFSEAFQRRFLLPKAAQARKVYERARDRGEISPDVDLDLLSEVLGAVILHRSFVLQRPVDNATVERIIDEIVMPAATRTSNHPTTTSQPR
jgi:AcrR family transcriptional regulator